MFSQRPIIVTTPARTEYVTREVHEHRAPTDQSVALLREMEGKAEAEIIKAVSVANTTFECVVHKHLDAASDKLLWRAVFKLNGKHMTADIETDRPRGQLAPVEEMRANFEKLRDEMAKVIASEVINDAFVATMRERMG